jgi:hypothetical protein
MPPPPVPPRQPAGPPPQRTATVLETDEDVRRALQSGAAAAPRPVGPTAQPFRPTQRPPVALLTVCDDGKSDGEVIRLRVARFAIGRTEGDLLIPHDDQISSRHVEIVRQQAGGQWRWVVTDLQSTNGLFVRASRVALSDGTELLVGRGRYRFEATVADGTVEYVSDAPTSSTVAWGGAASPVPQAVLTELVPGGVGARVTLTGVEYWIGTDPTCAVCRAGDPFTELRHVRLHRDARGWHAENNKSPNGLWLRVPHITVDAACLFQIGEQRFRLQVG